MSEAATTDKFFVDDIVEEIFSAAAEAEKEICGDEVDGSVEETENPVFKNPNKIPIDALHLERTVLERNRKAPATPKGRPVDFKKYYKARNEVIPALDVSWLTEQELSFYYSYQPYFPQFSKEDNYLFKEQNVLFCQTLQDLLDYDFHIFWCVLIFSAEAGTVLKEFVSEPVYNFDYDCLDAEETDIYAGILINSLHVYQRMLRFKESETEFINEEVAMNFLIAKKHLSTPIIMKLAMLYQALDEKFVKKVVRVYYAPHRKAVYTKELRDTLIFTKNLLEAVDNIVSETETCTLALPDSEVRRKPDQFDPHWPQEMAAHLVECFYSLSSFLPLSDDAIEIAIELDLPKLIPMIYNSVFEELDSYMADRASVPDRLRFNIHTYIRVARNEAVKAFDAIASYCIRKIVELANHDKQQESLVEMYLEWIQEALEYDTFINDYNSYSNISLQIDQISSFYPNIERLRIKYIKASIETIVARLNSSESLEAMKRKLNNCKLSDLWSNIWKDVVADPPPQLDFTLLEQKEKQVSDVNSVEAQNGVEGKPSEAEIEKMIQSVMETLPHLGDGFILQCLQHYHYNVTDTLAAILDENLPPHLAEIPFDTIRIPEETNPEPQPVLAYKGKREDYKDAMQLLNDKTGIKDIKELIVINSMVKEDPYDDEFDDRTLDDEPTPRGDDDDEARVLRHLREGIKNLPVVSDPSDESTEEEEEATARKRDAFCEDPAVIRARREAQRKGNAKGRNFDVVGKPKGQGQEKDVQHNRDKKNVHKSSRANHNRKSGAQWKRSRGMMPS